MKNIYLVGFMGTGKTAVGKALAQKLAMQFLDLDDLIEESQHQKIVDIFAKQGEPYFRDAESDALREVAAREDLVIGCGGGIVLREDNLNLMQESGFLICLDACLEVIHERTKSFEHRPLLNVEAPEFKIKELLEKRAPYYAKIKHHIDTSSLSIEEVVLRILKLIGKEND